MYPHVPTRALCRIVFAVRRPFESSEEGVLRAFSQHMACFLELTYAFYPTLSLMQFKGFRCDEYKYDDGSEVYSLLEADYTLDCNSARYRRFRNTNLGLIAVTQLIPLMYFAILYRVRHLLHPPSNRSQQAQLRDRQKREQSHELKPYSFLFTHYNLDWWHLEVWEAYRRVAFISGLALIPDKTLR